ncbi:MAG: oligosaccharide flippase family protein [Thermoplasmata archaeon]
MSIKKSLESSFSLTFALYAAFFISFVYSIILVRVVSVEVMGMIGMGGTFIEIAILISTLGSISIIQTYTTYYLSRKEYGHLKYILKKSTMISLSIAGTISLITFMFSREISQMLYNTDIMDLPLKIVAILLLVNILVKILDTVIRASKQFKLYGTIQTMSTALNLLLTLSFIYVIMRYVSSDDDIIVAGSFLASICVALCCIALIIIKNKDRIKKLKSVDSATPTQEKILKFGASTASLELISMWGVYINALAVGYFLPPEEWGYYTIAVLIMSVVTVFKTVLNVIAYPALVDAHSRNDMKEFGLTIHIMFKYWSMFFIPLVVTLVLFIPYALPVIWGPAYEKSILITQIMLVGFVVQYYISIYSSALTAIEKPHMQFVPTIINVSMYIILGMTMVYYFGILGAAVTVLVSNVVSFFITRHYFIREQPEGGETGRRKFILGLLKVLVVELAIIIALFIPAWYAIEMFTNLNIQFILALLSGIVISLVSISYVFGRRRFSDDETNRMFDMFPRTLRPLLDLGRKVSVRIWRG